MNAPRFKPGDRALHTGRLVTVLHESLAHIAEQRTGARCWVVRFEGTGETRLTDERNLRPAETGDE